MHKEVKRELSEDATVEEDEKKAAKDLTGKGNILLVEDEDAVRMFASRALKNKGYKIYEANSGDKALKIVEELEGELDLIISDVVMPQMDGPTMVKKVKEKHPNLKVIFISAMRRMLSTKTWAKRTSTSCPNRSASSNLRSR